MTNCRDCGSPFALFPGKPGYVDQCENCARDVPLLGGNMIWTHKTAPSIEIKPMDQAVLFAKKQKRFGAGPLRSISQSKEQAHKSLVGQSPFEPGDGASKQGTGAEARALYYSKLGEKRSVKQ